MEDRFKLRCYHKKLHRYLTSNDIWDLTDAMVEDVYDLVCWFDNPISKTQITLAEEDVVFEQCIGLKDNNRKPIYEGDIVKAVYSDGTESRFGLPICRHRQCFNVGLNGSDAGWLNEDFIGEVEIVGNIHENPELLEEELNE